MTGLKDYFRSRKKRVIDGDVYTLDYEAKERSSAEARANHLRKHGYYARIIPTMHAFSGYHNLVYSRKKGKKRK